MTSNGANYAVCADRNTGITFDGHCLGEREVLCAIMRNTMGLRKHRIAIWRDE